MSRDSQHIERMKEQTKPAAPSSTAQNTSMRSSDPSVDVSKTAAANMNFTHDSDLAQTVINSFSGKP